MSDFWRDARVNLFSVSLRSHSTLRIFRIENSPISASGFSGQLRVRIPVSLDFCKVGERETGSEEFRDQVTMFGGKKESGQSGDGSEKGLDHMKLSFKGMMSKASEWHRWGWSDG